MLTIQLLGGFKLIHRSTTIPGLTRPRGKSLLAYLLLHHATPQDRGHLAYTFWPETSDRQARTNLRRELHQLRQLSPLFAALINSAGQSVQWQMPTGSTLDVAEFNHLLTAANRGADPTTRIHYYQAAIALYHGDLLPGLYDEWVLSKREELCQAYSYALETVTELLINERDYGAAITLTKHLLRYDPLYEAGYRQLMELYALQDDRARALHTYQSCVTVLERELGVPPSAEIEELYQRLLHTNAPRAAGRQEKPATTLHLVGRKAEWQTLLGAWRHAGKGRAHTVLIEGEAGIGKTRLAEELLEWANRQAIPTARTRSYAAEGALAYAPVIEWLRSPILRTAVAALEPVWRTEIARLLPELLTDFPNLPRPEPLSERWQRQRLFEALARAVTVDERPKLLLIDDLQWCDQETLEWLRFLLRFAPAAPLLVLGTIRTEEVDGSHPLHALTRELRTGEQLTVVALTALSAAETTELAIQVNEQVNGQALDESAANHLFIASEGNPLFVVEMVRAGVRSDGGGAGSSIANQQTPTVNALPPKVYAVIQHRLAQLSPGAHALASLAATIGRAFTVALLTIAGELCEDEVVNGLDELWQRRVIRESGDNAYDFSHDRIRDVIYSALTPVRRRLLHRRAAMGLAELHRDHLADVSAQIAVHYEQAGIIEEAILWRQRAADVARRLYAAIDAVSHYQAAFALLQTLPQTETRKRQALGLLLPLSSHLVIVHGFASQEAMTVSAQARELSAYAEDYQLELFYALRRMGDVSIAQGKAGTAQELAVEILAIAERSSDPRLLMEAHWLYGRALLHLGQFAAAHGEIEQAIALYDSNATYYEPPDAYPVLLCYLGVVRWMLGYPDQALRLAGEALALINVGTDPFEKAKCYFVSKMIYRNVGDLATAFQLERDSINLGRHSDMLVARLDGEITLALAATAATAQENMRTLRSNIDQFLNMGYTMFTTIRLELLARLYADHDRLDRALTILQESLDLSAQSDEHWWDAELHRLQGELFWQQGAIATEIAACYRRAIAIARQQTAKSLELRATTNLAALMIGQGEVAAAKAMLQPIYAWFREGFDTHDLRAAARLLNP